ncbi:MAG TPA: DUF389 domain-containing protein [Candidatus Sulfotelmatobacter sp.]|nr:DUF389 domain-containing protein [Candidatus Sulfotelmatobacter sp.]
MSIRQLAPWWRQAFGESNPSDHVDRAEMAGLLTADSRLNLNFVVLILASCAIATLGLLENSVAVIIGAMIIAPLMPAIQAAAFSALDGAAAMFWRSLITLAVGIALAVVLSALLARAVGLSEFGSEILSRARPNLLDLGIALTAGAVGAFARIRSSVTSAIAGTAIAVALMPPLCVVGIGAAAADWEVSGGALLLFVTNLLGITLASMCVFLVGRYARRRAGSALAWAGGLTALVVVPLAFSLQALVRQTALEGALRRALTTQTVTFRQATLVSSDFDWLSRPPTATLLIRSRQLPTAHQVSLLEAFAQRATGQRFRLVVDVSQIQRVTSVALPPEP